MAVVLLIRPSDTFSPTGGEGRMRGASLNRYADSLKKNATVFPSPLATNKNPCSSVFIRG